MLQQYNLCFYQTPSYVLSDMLFRQAILCVLAFEIQRNILPQPHRNIFLRRSLPMREEKKPSRHASSIAQDIDQTILDILSSYQPLLPENSATIVIFVFICMEEALLVAHEGGHVAPYIGYMSVFCIIVNLVYVMLRARQSESMILHLNEMVHWMVQKDDQETLQFVICNVNISSLLELGGERMLELLTNYALDKKLLSLMTKAILVTALQEKNVRFNQMDQVAMLRIFLSCRGTDLTALKNVIDGSGNYQNLYKLVYKDVHIAYVRKRLLGHLQREAYKVREKLGCAFGIKVLSDVDDTLHSSGGHFPAGVDARFPKHMVYPGCLTLFQILDRSRGPWCDDMKSALAIDGMVSCNLVFLSARPHVYKNIAESHSYRLFEMLVRDQRMHSLPTLLPGRLRSGIGAMFMQPLKNTMAWKNVGINKFKTYVDFRELYLEYDYIFFGDNGQGDLYAAQRMLANSDTSTRRRSTEALERAEPSATSSLCDDASGDSSSSDSSDGNAPRTPCKILACVIHEVLHESKALAMEPSNDRGPAWREEQKRNRLLFHRTYVGAAVELHRCNPDLVTVDDLKAVATEAAQEFEGERYSFADYAGESHDFWTDVEKELNEDIERANVLLREAGRELVPLVLPPPESSMDDRFFSSPRAVPAILHRMGRQKRQNLTTLSSRRLDESPTDTEDRPDSQETPDGFYLTSTSSSDCGSEAEVANLETAASFTDADMRLQVAEEARCLSRERAETSGSSVRRVSFAAMAEEVPVTPTRNRYR
uniref:Uncharacterized protein n=1 Tax=Zooxanthella nutricula TaxID=1333877 RepID=A0A7S2PID7_9DINO